MRGKKNPATLKGIHRVKKRMADGSIKEYWYHRVTGLPLDKSNLAQSFADAEKKKRRNGEKTLTDLIRFFDSSSTFDSLSDDSRKEYVWKLRRIEAKWGSVPEETFNSADDADAFAADALAWHQELGKTSLRSADNLMSALCRVLSFAKEKRRIKHHPIPSFERLYKSDRADKVWPEELQLQFIRMARPAMKTAMILVRNTAMRAADIRKFPWTHYNGHQVLIRSSKTGKLLWIPATRELKAHLDGLERTGALVMLTPTAKAYAKRYFNEHWREDCDKVDAENAKLHGENADFVKTADLNFHDNRGTAATLLAEAGATAPEIAEAMTWTTDKAQKIIDAYLARRGVLAANAIQKLEDYREGKIGLQTR
ncbi:MULTISPECIES: tyrosine-type recombinase/integrase [unclassified Bradyrhizobium]